MDIYNIPIDSNRKDSRFHGSYEFPIAVYDTKLENLLYGFINWHWHDEMHFYVVNKGSVIVHVNSIQSCLLPEEGILINSGSLHMVKPNSQGENSIITIFVHPRLFSSFQGSIIERKYVKPYLKDGAFSFLVLRKEELWQIAVLERLAKIYDIFGRTYPFFELDTALLLGGIWKSIISHIPSDDDNTPVETKYNDERLKTLLSYVHKHYAEKLTLEKIAETINLSPNECCRFFKRNMAQTLFEYIIDYRITKGSELLFLGNKSVQEIAYLSGFGDVSYFITKFKNKTGYTPKEFQKKMKNNEGFRTNVSFPKFI